MDTESESEIDKRRDTPAVVIGHFSGAKSTSANVTLDVGCRNTAFSAVTAQPMYFPADAQGGEQQSQLDY